LLYLGDATSQTALERPLTARSNNGAYGAVENVHLYSHPLTVIEIV
jgi:hypothetical protein